MSPTPVTPRTPPVPVEPSLKVRPLKPVVEDSAMVRRRRADDDEERRRRDDEDERRRRASNDASMNLLPLAVAVAVTATAADTPDTACQPSAQPAPADVSSLACVSAPVTTTVDMASSPSFDAGSSF